MQEDTATVKVNMTIKLTGEPGAEGTDQPGISAEEKAENVVQLVRDQVASTQRSYDSGVEVTGKITYVGKSEEDL